MIQENGLDKDLLDHLFCGAALYEYDGKLIKEIHINKRYWELVNRSPDELKKNTVLDAIHPEDVRIVQQEIESAICQKRNAECDLRIRHGKDAYKTFHLKAVIEEKSKGIYMLYVTYVLVDERELSFQKMIPVALEMLMDSSEDYTYLKDRNLRYICCSKSLAKMLGIKNTTDIVGKTDYDFFDRDRADNLAEIDKKVIESGKTQFNHSVLIQEKNGTVRVLNASKYPILDTNGNVIGIYGINKDNTGTKERDSQLHLLISSIPGGIASYSIHNDVVKILYFNEGYYKSLGYSREQYVSITSQDLLALVYSEDRHIIQEMLTRVRAPINLETVQECEYRCVTKEGTLCWMNMKCGLSRIGKDTLILNVVRIDITEKKRVYEKLRLLEEEYRLAAQHSGRTIGRYDVTHHTLTLTSKAAERLLLPECVEDVPYGMVKLGKISQDTASAYIEFYENIIHGEMSGSVLFQKLLGNKWCWINAHFTTLFSDEGKPVSALVSYIDVTNQYEKDVIYRKWQQSLKERADDSYSVFRCNLSLDTSFDSSEGSLIPFPYVEGMKMTFDECTRNYAKKHVVEEDREEYISSMKSAKLNHDFVIGKRKHILEYREITEGENYRWLRRTVDLIEIPDSTGIMAYIFFENIDKSKRAELNIQTMVETDPLTGLLNREAFKKMFSDILEQRNNKSIYAFFVLDIDGFSRLNTLVGEVVGEQVLRTTADMIRSALMEEDFVGRFDDDEFVICLCNLPNKDVVRKKARRISKLLSRMITPEVHTSVSIGIAICPDNGCDFNTLYRKANRAMYHIKENGKDNYGFCCETGL